MNVTEGPTAAPWRWRWVEIVTLSAFAFTQPLYALFAENPTFLVAHELAGTRLVAFALAILFIPALVLVALDQLAGLAPAGATRWIRATLRGLLLGLVVGPPATAQAGMDGTPAMAGLAGAVVVGVALFVRFDVVRRLVRFALFGPPLFLTVFLFLSPASGLLGSGDAEVMAVPAAERTSVVWLTFDQLPLGMMVDDDGEIVAERFPAFARLAESSTWYPRATTVASSTNLAMTSALSGRHADPSGLPVASQVPVNLFTVLAGTHEVHALENVTQLCPHSVCGDVPTSVDDRDPSTAADTWVVLVRAVLPDAVADRFVPEIDDRWAGFGAEEFNEVVVDGTGEATTTEEIVAARASGDDRARFESFLDGLGTADGPALHYLHMEKPHEPLLFVPDGRIYDSCSCFKVTAEGRWPGEPAMSRQRVQRYVLQAMHVDRMLGRTLDRLEETGMADDTLLIVVSDHGASMLPGASNRVLTPGNQDEILPVPLFVRYPGQDGAVVDERVAQLTDLLPTILDSLDIDLQERFDGTSLLGEVIAGDATELITADGIRRLEREPDVTASAYVDWLDELFPDPSDPWAQGPAASLVGTPPEPVGSSRLTVSLENAFRFDEVELDNGFVPAHLIGQLHGADRPTELAVAVNGTVAGVGTTFWKDLWQVSLMIDPSYLVEGSNTIEFYEVAEAGLLRVASA